MKPFGKKALPLVFLAVLMAADAWCGEESLSHVESLPPPPREAIPWGKDPFAAPFRKAVKTEVPLKLKLTAIFYNAANPSAIINDRIVYKGSLLDGQKVIDIGRTHVILQGESGPVRLDMAGIPESSDVRK